MYRRRRRPRLAPMERLLLLVLIGLIGWLMYYIYDTWDVLARGGVSPESWTTHLAQIAAREDAEERSPVSLTERQVFLLLGVDNRGGSRGRADTIMVGVLDPNRTGAKLLSIPRDTLVDIPGRGLDKLNHAYAFGGAELTRNAVANFLDIPIDRYVVVDFDGFRTLIDAVGGVEIQVEKPMHYEDPADGLAIHFEPGLHHMDGQKALEYARFRSDSEGDLGRMRRQQTVIRAALNKALSPAVLPRIPQIVRAVFDVVDTDLALWEMIRLADVGKDVLQHGQFQTATLSPGNGRLIGGVFYFITDRTVVRAEAHRFLFETELTATQWAEAQAAQSAFETALREWAAARETASATTPDAGAESVAYEGEGAERGVDAPHTAETQGEEERVGDWHATVRITDLSGGAVRLGLLQRWAMELAQSGFYIVGADVGDDAIPHTQLILRTTDERVHHALAALFPEAEVIRSSDGDAPDVEIRIGQDALEWFWSPERSEEGP